MGKKNIAVKRQNNLGHLSKNTKYVNQRTVKRKSENKISTIEVILLHSHPQDEETSKLAMFECALWNQKNKEAKIQQSQLFLW